MKKAFILFLISSFMVGHSAQTMNSKPSAAAEQADALTIHIPVPEQHVRIQTPRQPVVTIAVGSPLLPYDGYKGHSPYMPTPTLFDDETLGGDDDTNMDPISKLEEGISNLKQKIERSELSIMSLISPSIDFHNQVQERRLSNISFINMCFTINGQEADFLNALQSFSSDLQLNSTVHALFIKIIQRERTSETLTKELKSLLEQKDTQNVEVQAQAQTQEVESLQQQEAEQSVARLNQAVIAAQEGGILQSEEIQKEKTWCKCRWF